ncbi:MAG: NAD(P)H-hydrate dehydratase [Alistipes sp.]|nr:NAD(P)H-hydrate dehydratase [Alistipes sp.]
MKILTGEQIRQADLTTIANEPVSSLALMERAAESLAREICGIVAENDRLLILAGKGNNGGDGLAVARILHNAGFSCSVSTLYPAGELSDDCRFNFERLPGEIPVYRWDGCIPAEPGATVVVDALLGSGLRGPARGETAEAIEAINEFEGPVISIDIPSGMPTEPATETGPMVRADFTLTIEFPKLSMLLPATGGLCGDIRIIPIDLDPGFIDRAESPYRYVTPEFVVSMLRGRPKFGHKGTFGHALVISGSTGMFGAAILSIGGALRSGCGLVTAHIPRDMAAAMYASAPSAMISSDDGEVFSSLPRDLDRYDVCGCGPGIGQAAITATALERLMRTYGRPMVLDADALNIIAANAALLELIPPGSVLTPHPGEFERLVGKWDGEDEKLARLRSLAVRLESTVVLKGAYTAVCGPDGTVCFNSTGTPGMAKGGSGDVLTGFITGLIARGYAPWEAAIIGVYLHGKGGEKAAEYYGAESMNSSDLPDFIADAYNELYNGTEG